jgi:NAD dependent epimerase/dehydratase family enzyme
MSPSIVFRAQTDLRNAGLPPNTHAVVNLTGRTIGDPKYRWTDTYKTDVWTSRVNSTTTLREVRKFLSVVP